MARRKTRYGRYKLMKWRHVHKGRRMRHVGWGWQIVNGKWKRTARKKPFEYVRQAAVKLQRFHGQANGRPPIGLPNLGQTVHYNGGNWGMPHIVRHVPGGPPVPFNGRRHLDRPVCWFHVRRGPIIKRRGGQMNALQRRVWGANWFYHREGMHSSTDPLGRLPNELTFQWGVDQLYPEGDWPAVSSYDV